jgi:hypothetical protein
MGKSHPVSGNIRKYLQEVSKKIPKVPKRGELWSCKTESEREWTITGLYKVWDLYSLAIGYPECTPDTLIVCCVNKENDCTIYNSSRLEDFLINFYFKKKIY